MLRERVFGTLERLSTLPIGRLDLLAGYALAFGALAAVQAGVVSAVALLALDVHRAGAVVALAIAVLGVAFGLFVSAFARSEFQAVRFMPAVLFAQILLCGLLVPPDRMAGWLEGPSWAVPLTYASDALDRVGEPAELGARFWIDVLVVGATAAAALALGALTLRRRTP